MSFCVFFTLYSEPRTVEYHLLYQSYISFMKDNGCLFRLSPLPIFVSIPRISFSHLLLLGEILRNPSLNDIYRVHGTSRV